MLDIGWAELLVVGVVALLVVGPKELPGLLRTLGKYLGMVRRQANEFKAQFNEAIKDTELDELRKEVDAIRSDTASTLRDVQSSVSVSDSDVGRSTTGSATASDDTDPTWMTEGAPPSPAAAAALAASGRAEAVRKGGEAAKATASSATSTDGGDAKADAAKSSANGAARPQAVDAGA